MFGCVIKAEAQITITPQLVSMGLFPKDQLWNLLITKSSASDKMVHLELLLTDAGNGQNVLVGTSSSFNISPGANNISSSTVSPVQYNVLNPYYSIDASPSGYIPFGQYIVYYVLYDDSNDAGERLAEESATLELEPLSPPELIEPNNGDSIITLIPQFMWLDPMPSNLFVNLRYDIDVIEILSSQSSADAMQQNIPLWHYENLNANSVLYPISTPALEVGKSYAWRISARSGSQIVTRSETWSFYVKSDSIQPATYVYGNPFVKLKKEEDESYTINSNYLHYEYLNELNDSLVQIHLYDLSSSQRNPLDLPEDYQQLTLGQNFIKYNLGAISGLQDRHIYLFELINSKRERWHVKFELILPNQ